MATSAAAEGQDVDGAQALVVAAADVAIFLLLLGLLHLFGLVVRLEVLLLLLVRDAGRVEVDPGLGRGHHGKADATRTRASSSSSSTGGSIATAIAAPIGIGTGTGTGPAVRVHGRHGTTTALAATGGTPGLGAPALVLALLVGTLRNVLGNVFILGNILRNVFILGRGLDGLGFGEGGRDGGGLLLSLGLREHHLLVLGLDLDGGPARADKREEERVKIQNRSDTWRDGLVQAE